jgi:hypothetical protein
MTRRVDACVVPTESFSRRVILELGNRRPVVVSDYVVFFDFRITRNADTRVVPTGSSC